ncbi:MAG: TlpA disulfide reductase family protein [Halofilum sp. (in: g-proteobacteria)]|nr:TlpA disulfide reductase family protein [Halofilum sp. (in: g-proteobacteria)]
MTMLVTMMEALALVAGYRTLGVVRRERRQAGRRACPAACGAAPAALALAAVSAGAAAAPAGLGVHDQPRQVPTVEFTNGSGERLTLAGLRGQVVVLNVWATWCPPCRSEMPTLDRLQAELGGSGLEVVALSVDRDGVERVREFYAEEGIEELGIYAASSMDVLSRLEIVGLPTTLVLDARGREIARVTGEADWATPQMLAHLRELTATRSEATTGNGG